MMVNLLQAQQYIEEGNHEAAKEILESALRDEPRNRDARKMLHELERSTAPMITVFESPPAPDVLGIEAQMSEDLPAPIPSSALQIVNSMNDAAIGMLIVLGILLIGGLGWGVWALIGWVQTAVSTMTVEGVFDGLMGVYVPVVGMALGLGILAYIVKVMNRVL
jgi:hypothetical protein